jgi:repressor LexA
VGRRKLVDSQTVLATIQRWVVQRGMPPTIDELRQALGVGSTRTILRYLQALEAAGAIRRWEGARGIRVLRAPTQGVETVQVPLVGEAPAGPSMLAEQNLEGWLRVPTTMAKPGSARFFLLRVRGDSMNRAKVQGEKVEDGDLVLVRQQPTARTGEIVVAHPEEKESRRAWFGHGRGYSQPTLEVLFREHGRSRGSFPDQRHLHGLHALLWCS